MSARPLESESEAAARRVQSTDWPMHGAKSSKKTEGFCSVPETASHLPHTCGVVRQPQHLRDNGCNSPKVCEFRHRAQATRSESSSGKYRAIRLARNRFGKTSRHFGAGAAGEEDYSFATLTFLVLNAWQSAMLVSHFGSKISTPADNAAFFSFASRVASGSPRRTASSR